MSNQSKPIQPEHLVEVVRILANKGESVKPDRGKSVATPSLASALTSATVVPIVIDDIGASESTDIGSIVANAVKQALGQT